MKDTLTIGTIAGLSSTVVMYILSMIFKALDWIKVTTLDYAAALFLNPNQADTIAGTIVAIISQFMIGVAGGVLLAYFVKIAGNDYCSIRTCAE